MLFLAVLALATISVTLRLNLLFTSRVHPDELAAHRARLFPAIVVAEALLAIVLLAVAALIAGAHDGIAALLVTLAVATLASLDPDRAGDDEGRGREAVEGRPPRLQQGHHSRARARPDRTAWRCGDGSRPRSSAPDRAPTANAVSAIETRGALRPHRGVKLPHQLVAVLPGHRDVAHEHVRAILDARDERLLRGGRDPHLAPADSNTDCSSSRVSPSSSTTTMFAPGSRPLNTVAASLEVGRPRVARAAQHANRQADGEARALVQAVALGADLPAVQLDEVADDREAEAEAAVRARARGVGLAERVEHVREERRVDADAGVGDRQLVDGVRRGGAES